ncbi:DUF4398 domain-containing protein [Rhodocyclus tenuis]|uniref:DUF4398 domain-containing protein n=2 Tax=Rhodocyclus TaxID=1064 RepID=A0A6L5JWQ8_RHOTE|nr:DUF4398 domain-containing protein [Rhodocyclus gracilis]MQY51232.1 DUF4398 domain-containing protein [Rhodocyclus gracilis]NJA89915.1 DUF4398 domain-containing protein [Rhodocyclus gracilis]
MNSRLSTSASRRRFTAIHGGTHVWLAIGTTLLLAACASTPPPTEQLAVSTAALESATKAGAGEAAPSDLLLAREKLDRARAAFADGRNDDALKLAQQAELDAHLAEVRARSSKARAAAAELREGVRVLREEMYRRPR